MRRAQAQRTQRDARRARDERALCCIFSLCPDPFSWFLMACEWLLIHTRHTSQYVVLSFLYGCAAARARRVRPRKPKAAAHAAHVARPRHHGGCDAGPGPGPPSALPRHQVERHKKTSPFGLALLGASWQAQQDEQGACLPASRAARRACADAVAPQTIVIDCRAHMLGRLASIVAKELLSGQHIVRATGTAASACARLRAEPQAACGVHALGLLAPAWLPADALWAVQQPSTRPRTMRARAGAGRDASRLALRARRWRPVSLPKP